MRHLEAEGLLYVIRLNIGRLPIFLRDLSGPPDHVRRFHASFSYQAGSWNKKRRVVAKVEWHPGELVPGGSSLICRDHLRLMKAESGSAFGPQTIGASASI